LSDSRAARQLLFRLPRNDVLSEGGILTQRSRFVALVAVFAVGLASIAVAANSTVTINNKSKWQIDQFFMSPADTDEWGPDQLGDKVIGTGQSFTLTDVPCNKFDIKIVDEDGDECELRGISLCANSATWNITDQELLTCEGHQ
jgi:hypothetical protein